MDSQEQKLGQGFGHGRTGQNLGHGLRHGFLFVVQIHVGDKV